MSDSGIPWTAVHHAPLSMGFPRQECWSGLPFPSAGDLPNAGMEPGFPASPTLAGRFFFIPLRHPGSPKGWGGQLPVKTT